MRGRVRGRVRGEGPAPRKLSDRRQSMHARDARHAIPMGGAALAPAREPVDPLLLVLVGQLSLLRPETPAR